MFKHAVYTLDWLLGIWRWMFLILSDWKPNEIEMKHTRESILNTKKNSQVTTNKVCNKCFIGVVASLCRYEGPVVFCLSSMFDPLCYQQHVSHSTTRLHMPAELFHKPSNVTGKMRVKYVIQIAKKVNLNEVCAH